LDTRARLFLVVVALASLLFIARMLRSKQLKPKYAMLWALIAMAILPLAIWPRLLDAVSDWIGISYAPATLFLIADIMLLLIAVHFSWELSRLEDRSRILAQELALLTASTPEPARGQEEKHEDDGQSDERDPASHSKGQG
jgi:hypothetical protein